MSYHASIACARRILAVAACLASLLPGCAGRGAAPTADAPGGGRVQGGSLPRSRAASDGAAHARAGAQFARGAAARFHNPCGVATDGPNLYVADMNNNTIRKVAAATGAVTTLAGFPGPAGSSDGAGKAARFDSPCGVAVDGASLYVANRGNHTIRKVSLATGAVTTLAGSAGLPGCEDGRGRHARFYHPYGIASDGANLYVADMFGQTVRRVVIATGAVTTLAGSPGLIGSADGKGAAAMFYYPSGIATDGRNLYVADKNNHTIRKVAIATGTVTTLAGSAGWHGSADGKGAAARFRYPEGIATDGTYLYVADSENHAIRRIAIATGVVTTLAGKPGAAGSADGAGAAARFYNPFGIATDGTDLYVSDTYNHAIRKIAIATGTVTTLAGKAGAPGSADGAASDR